MVSQDVDYQLKKTLLIDPSHWSFPDLLRDRPTVRLFAQYHCLDTIPRSFHDVCWRPDLGQGI